MTELAGPNHRKVLRVLRDHAGPPDLTTSQISERAGLSEPEARDALSKLGESKNHYVAYYAEEDTWALTGRGRETADDLDPPNYSSDLRA